MFRRPDPNNQTLIQHTKPSDELNYNTSLICMFFTNWRKY